MYKIKKIAFINHPVLKNLTLDFCDSNGNIVDTIIFAGENGTGKSTILNELYKISSHTMAHDCNIEIDANGKSSVLEYRMKRISSNDMRMHISNNNDINHYVYEDRLKELLPFHGIFSDVDINFHSSNISNVTSLLLDSTNESRKSAGDLPTQINQLLVDVQALDDADISHAVRENPAVAYENLNIDERMPRFTKAFNNMFDDLSYSRIETQNGRKIILFKQFRYHFIIGLGF